MKIPWFPISRLIFIVILNLQILYTLSSVIVFYLDLFLFTLFEICTSFF